MDDMKKGHKRDEGLQPAKTAPVHLQDRFRGYVVDPVKVADRMVNRAALRVAARQR